MKAGRKVNPSPPSCEFPTALELVALSRRPGAWSGLNACRWKRALTLDSACTLALQVLTCVAQVR